VLLIEHNLDVIKLADWVIDLGPEAGAAGGELVAAGRPEDVAKVAGSHTGQWLRTVLPGFREYDETRVRSASAVRAS
jgi:excinuclease ABC subunit A